MSNTNDFNELVIAAECVVFYYKNFNQEFLKNNKKVDFLCPKQENKECINNLIELIYKNKIKKIIIIRINLECCKYVTTIVKEALQKTNESIIIEEKLININK